MKTAKMVFQNGFSMFYLIIIILLVVVALLFMKPTVLKKEKGKTVESEKVKPVIIEKERPNNEVPIRENKSHNIKYKIYRWRDAEGKEHFSQIPPQGVDIDGVEEKVLVTPAAGEVKQN